MTRLGDMARITTRGRGDSPDSLEEKTWLIYTRLRGEATANGRPSPYEGVAGYQWRGALKRIISSVYPEMEMLDDLEKEAFTRPIYAALKATGNAVCLVRGVRGEASIWWVRKDFNNATLVQVPTPRPTTGASKERDRLEAKVTPTEAGEDREPAPVQVRQVEGTSMTSKVVKALKSTAQPLTPLEITVALGIEPYIKDGKQQVSSSVKDELTKLLEVGQVHRRYETPGERAIRAGLEPGRIPTGRFGFLYSVKNPVPMRTARIAVQGVELNVPELPQDAGAKNGARLREQRNSEVLDVICAAGVRRKAITIADIAKKLGCGRGRVEDAVKDLLAAGVIHEGPLRDRQRVFYPIDVPFGRRVEVKKVKAQTEPKTKKAPAIGRDGIRASTMKAVEDTLQAQTRPRSGPELAKLAGCSTSTIYKCAAILAHEGKVEYGRSGGFRTFKWIGDTQLEIPQEATPVVATPAPAAPQIAGALDLGKILEDVVARAVEQATAQLAEENAQLKAKLDTLRNALS